jgi:LPS sulfotransferase NodH
MVYEPQGLEIAMKSALDYLLSSENAGEVLSFLRGRGPHAHIIAPNRVRDKVFPGGSNIPRPHSATWSQDITDVARAERTGRNIIVIAEGADKERAILESLVATGAKTYGLFSHVVPALLCSTNGLAAGRPVTDLKRYAILCVPRSGSRYLSAVLSIRGVGVPKEHIREPLAQIITAGKLGFGHAVEALEKFGQRNGIFGTKLISTFLLHASHGRMSELKKNISWMAERGYRFVHLDRPLGDAVISSYIAFQMRKWHFFGAMDEDAREKLDSLVFEDGAAWEEFVRFRSEKVVIDAVCASLDAPVVPYSKVEADAEGVVSMVCGFINADLASLKPGSVAVPIQTRSESPTYQIFADRLAAILERRAADIEPATIRKVRALTALSHDEAEEIVSEYGQQA